VQATDPWRWSQVFLPLGERFWPFYRPISMEAFFWLGHRLFGLFAFGYFAVSLLLHFATALLVHRVARQLGFDPRVAIATAVLSVSRHPSLTEIYYGSVFMYVGVAFFSLWCVTRSLDAVGGGGWRPRLEAIAAFLLALGCNEIAITVPVVAGLVALGAAPARPDRAFLGRVGGAVAPLLAIGAAYLVFRFGLIAPAGAGALYSPALGWHVPWNAARLVGMVFGNAATLAGAALLGLASLSVLAARRDRAALPWLGRVGGACFGWIAAVGLPFALLPFAQPRWAMNLEIPVCLLLGAFASAACRAAAPRPRALEVALATLLFAAVPYGALVARAADPLGAHPQRLVRFLDAQRPPIPEAAPIVLLFGAPGLASAEQGERFRYLAYGGGVLNAMDPTTRRVLRFQDLAQRPARNTLRSDSVYLVLLPDLDVAKAKPDLLERELRRGLATHRP
jgi:hypothetical protein